jgi:predicted metalloprotease with PDZ domain
LSAGDVLVAIDGLRVTASNFDTLLARFRVGDRIEVHAFRRDELFVTLAKLQAADAPQFSLTLQAKPAAAARLRKAWLGE